jgi:hypothetical protein
MATITNNAQKIITENETNDDDYNLLFSKTIKQYVKEMTEMIENDYEDLTDEEKEEYKQDGGAEKDWREISREIVVNTRHKTEENFMDTLDEEITAIGTQRVIMKMMKIVMEYSEGFDGVDISVYSDIGKLYQMWIYIVTEDVEFKIEN